jgi:GNAT superfamily N-acetyltransferase
VTVPADQLPAPFPPVRVLRPDDQGRCVALSIDRGWSPDRVRWALLLDACEVFGVDAPDGRGLAGAVVLTRYEPGLASVGMMLVAARYERRGLGRALMEHLLRAAGDGVTVTLFATTLGRPLYEKLGFTKVRGSASFIGHFRPAAGDATAGGSPAAGGVRLAAPDDLPAILAADRAAFGADRAHVLRPVAGLADRISVLESDGAVAGYAFAWRNEVNSTVVGPLIAPDDEAARRLVTAVAAPAGTMVRVDLDPAGSGLPAWAEARGLALSDHTTVMARGGLPRPPGAGCAATARPARAYAPISVALS